MGRPSCLSFSTISGLRKLCHRLLLSDFPAAERILAGQIIDSGRREICTYEKIPAAAGETLLPSQIVSHGGRELWKTCTSQSKWPPATIGTEMKYANVVARQFNASEIPVIKIVSQFQILGASDRRIISEVRIAEPFTGRIVPRDRIAETSACTIVPRVQNSEIFACTAVPQAGKSETFTCRSVPRAQISDISACRIVTRGRISGMSSGRLVPQAQIFHGITAADSTTRPFSSVRGAESEAASQESTSQAEEYLPGGRYCILLTGHASDYTMKLYGGYGQMFIKLLSDPHETWDIFVVVDGQFPAEEELATYDGFVVTGSRHDAHGNEEWISKLCTLVKSLHERKQKTLGICFGHQVLSRALGGKTGKAEVGWEIGLRTIQTTEALATKSYASGVPRVFSVYESHRDQVLEVPPGAELLGYSERTGIEMFSVGDHALGMQGHPEFSEDVVIELIDSRLASGILKEEEAIAAKATIQAGRADREALIRLCKGFLKGRH